MKHWKLSLCLTLLLLLAVSTAALAASPGSAGDPLVTKTWVENYVNKAFDALQAQLDQVQARFEQQNGVGAVDIRLWIGKGNAQVNGSTMPIDADNPAVAAQLKTDSAGFGYTMVPIRFIAESLGVQVQWLASTRQVMFTDGNRRVVLTVDSKGAAINGVEATMEYAPFIENQRTFVHIRFVMEAFNCKVSWDQEQKLVTISR